MPTKGRRYDLYKESREGFLRKELCNQFERSSEEY